MKRYSSIRRLGIAFGLWSLGLPGTAVAGIHTWDVNEVFSNADGSIQFIELRETAGGAGETGVGTGSLSSNTQLLAFGQGAVAPPTSFKHYLIGTQSFADLPGAVTPNVIIPLAKIPFFNTAGDTVAFVGIDSWTFGTVPTDGINSLNRVGGSLTNSPTNYAGQSGQVDASPPPPPPTVPAMSPLVVGLLAALLTGAGALLALRRRAH
jgi:hypothetical protein